MCFVVVVVVFLFFCLFVCLHMYAVCLDLFHAASHFL